MLGGMILCSNAKTAFITPVNPEADSECPTFGLTCQIKLMSVAVPKEPEALTEPINTPFSPNTFPTALASIGSPVWVPVP